MRGQITTKKVSIIVSDSTTMDAYMASPSGGENCPGIIVFQEAFGVNTHIRDVTERFAREGYVALAPELFHRTAQGFGASYDNYDRTHVMALTDMGLEADVQAAFGFLKNDSQVMSEKIVCVGFCMGGRTAFLASSVVPLKAAVSFYGGNIALSLLDRVSNIRAPILLFWGGLDKHISKDQTRAMVDSLFKAEKPFVNIEFSLASHGFFCDARASYHKESAMEAWTFLLQFLKNKLS